MTYKQEITQANTALARDPRVVFLGYGITKTHAMGTLKDVPPAQLIETPVAENLMVGLAIGLSLRGQLPVVYFERCDFMLNALDAMVNHLNAIPIISRGQFRPAVLFRVVVGNREKALFTGHTHTQNFARALEAMVDKEFRVHRLTKEIYIRDTYARAHDRQVSFRHSAALFEYKDLI